jgi:hypothetical protein
VERLNLLPKAVNFHLFFAQNLVEVGHVAPPGILGGFWTR